MKKDFVMRGQTASGGTEVLNFSGFKPGLAYRLVEFQIYPSTNIGSQSFEACASITAGKTTPDPTNPNFNIEGLIATAFLTKGTSISTPTNPDNVVINDTFLITQNLILVVRETEGGGLPVNWQCRFEPVKMSGPQEAVTNYKQYTISDE